MKAALAAQTLARVEKVVSPRSMGLRADGSKKPKSGEAADRVPARSALRQMFACWQTGPAEDTVADAVRAPPELPDRTDSDSLELTIAA